MNDLENNFSDPDPLKFTEALDVILNRRKYNDKQAVQKLTLLLPADIPKQDIGRLLYWLREDNSPLRYQRLGTLTHQHDCPAGVVDFLTQLAFANQIPDDSSATLILGLFIRNGMTKHIATVRHVIATANDPGRVYMDALQYCYGSDYFIHDLNQLLNDKELIDAFPPAAWASLIEAHANAIRWNRQDEFGASYLKAVQEVFFFLVRHETLIREATEKAGTQWQFFQDLTVKHKPMYFFAEALKKDTFIRLFFTESRSGFLELKLLTERLRKNKAVNALISAKLLRKFTIRFAELDQFTIPIYQVMARVGYTDKKAKAMLAYFLNSSSGVIELANNKTWIDSVKNHEKNILGGLSKYLGELLKWWNPERLDELEKSYLADCEAKGQKLFKYILDITNLIYPVTQPVKFYPPLYDWANGPWHNVKLIELLINDKDLIDQVADHEQGNIELLLQAAGQFSAYFENPAALSNSYLKEKVSEKSALQIKLKKRT